MSLKSIVESLVFATDKPLAIKQLADLTNADAGEVKKIIAEIETTFAETGIELVEVGGGYQFRTSPTNANWVKKLLAGRPQRLTRAMLESLAIVAYRQPVTRPEIEDIRGVDCASTIRVLLERNLIRILGKKEEAGRPILYGTTKFFLEFFQMRDLRDLPRLQDFAELTEENAEAVEAQFGEGSIQETLQKLQEERERAEAAQAAAETTADASAATGDSAAEPAPPQEAAPVMPPKEERTLTPEQLAAEEEAAMATLDRAISEADGVLSEFKKSQKPPKVANPPADATSTDQTPDEVPESPAEQP